MVPTPKRKKLQVEQNDSGDFAMRGEDSEKLKRQKLVNDSGDFTMSGDEDFEEDGSGEESGGGGALNEFAIPDEMEITGSMMYKMIRNIEIEVQSIHRELKQHFNKKRKDSGKRVLKMENLDLPWKLAMQGMQISIGGSIVMLKQLTRKQVVTEVLRKQSTGRSAGTPAPANGVKVDGWSEPYVTSTSGEKRGLRKLVQKYLGHFLGRLDEPPRMGIAVAQFLWNEQHFRNHHMAPFASCFVAEKDNKDSTSYVRPDKEAVPNAEIVLFQKIIHYCGVGLLVRVPDKSTDTWVEFFNKARDSVCHRGVQSVPSTSKKTTPAKKISRQIPKMAKPILERDVDNDADWADDTDDALPAEFLMDEEEAMT